MKRERFGSLDVVLTGGLDREGGGSGPLVVLLHGFGAPGTDLVPLWRVLTVPRATRFAFPAAPIDLGTGGRAWWPLDVAEVERAIAEGRHREFSQQIPDGIVEARSQLQQCLDAMTEALSVDHLVLGGFSQGAMLSLDLALHDRRDLAGVALLSGTLISESEWVPRMHERAGLPVFQSHGRSDPILSYSSAERLRDLLLKHKLDHRWLAFGGGHEIPNSVLEALGTFLSDVCGRREEE